MFFFCLCIPSIPASLNTQRRNNLDRESGLRDLALTAALKLCFLGRPGSLIVLAVLFCSCMFISQLCCLWCSVTGEYATVKCLILSPLFHLILGIAFATPSNTEVHHFSALFSEITVFPDVFGQFVNRYCS